MKFDVSVSPGSGRFEITENNESVVVSGHVSILTQPGMSDDGPTVVLDDGSLPLSSDDIYKELRLRGYEYGPSFRGILSADGTGIFSNRQMTMHMQK